MNLSVPTNFDNDLVDYVKDFPVSDFYGKLQQDDVGGGRSSYMISPISKKQFAKHVAYVRESGYGFNYLLNSSCLNNMEATRSGQKKIRKLLQWMVDIGVTATTVANPLLLRIIKECYPTLKVRISVYADVDHVQRAVYWEKNGADVICLNSITVNRDLEALKSIRAAINTDLELLVNIGCLQSCSLAITHMNIYSNSSQAGHREGGFVLDHCMLECSREKITDKVNYLRSDWIRPEDITLYEELGYHNFKLAERSLPTSVMKKRIMAYSKKTYDGNLLDLVQSYGHKSNKESLAHYRKGRIWKMLKLARPFKVNLRSMLNIKKLSTLKGMTTPLSTKQPVYIDNKMLDGFLENVWKKRCRYQDCNQCRYCHDVAEKVVRVDPQYKVKCIDLHNKIEKSFVTGKMWGV